MFPRLKLEELHKLQIVCTSRKHKITCHCHAGGVWYPARVQNCLHINVPEVGLKEIQTSMDNSRYWVTKFQVIQWSWSTSQELKLRLETCGFSNAKSNLTSSTNINEDTLFLLKELICFLPMENCLTCGISKLMEEPKGRDIQCGGLWRSHKHAANPVNELAD